MNHDIRRYETTIDEIIKENDKITGVYIKKVKFVNENGRMKLQDVENTREYLPCDYLIIAMGFLGTTDDDLNNYKLDAINNKIKLNNFRYNDKISVCGDMKNGQSLVVIAIKDGIDCADQIINKYN
jgi:glutamate synthase (NADPH/NADH) small chain